MSAEEGMEKPVWRGRIHQVAFFISVPAGVALVVLADGWVAKLAAAIYALSLSAVFASSAAYHRGRWTPTALRRMKRLDHSMIFVLIAGSYTPVALLVLHGPWQIVMLSIVWTIAAVGITLKVVRIDGFRVLTSTLYMVAGWVALVAFPQILRTMPAPALILTIVGGLLYTAGAIVFATKHPDPSPEVFGYHEVWHAFMAAAVVCHFAMIALLVR
jgi:hemolysin III